MWKELYDHARVTLRVAEAVARDREEIREVRRELGEVAAAVQALRAEAARQCGPEARHGDVPPAGLEATRAAHGALMAANER